ncbi:hypothetical protein BC833DRAFT_581816 [Globomyces pollinis-pini]|nr:hypothetical protein BC833DRAFT_581816 [Globomyces pollinis-pini]
MKSTQLIYIISSLYSVQSRFGAQEQFFPPIAARIGDLCSKSSDTTGLCPTLRGEAIATVLANAGACDQQDQADKFVDFAKGNFKNQGDKDAFIQAAKDFRTMERNTNEPGKCSPLCNKEPKNVELKGLVQAQDPGCKSAAAASNNNVGGAATPAVADNNNTGGAPPVEEKVVDKAVEARERAEREGVTFGDLEIENEGIKSSTNNPNGDNQASEIANEADVDVEGQNPQDATDGAANAGANPTGNGASGVADSARLSFLQANAAALNNANTVPLTAPEIIPTNRKRTADEGCIEAGDGFLCVDLGRNVRCVGGKVAKNFVNPFSGNDLIKACVNGFCAGTAVGSAKGGNKCVGTAEQAIAGNKNGNEFFLPPK